jgi:hypothetical protein
MAVELLPKRVRDHDVVVFAGKPCGLGDRGDSMKSALSRPSKIGSSDISNG